MSICLRRREFIAGLSGAAALPLAVNAQQQTKPIIGWLTTQPGVQDRVVIDPFRRGLAEIGFLEGRDVTVEYHTAEGHLEQLPPLAADLVRRRVAVNLRSKNRVGTGRQGGDADHPSRLFNRH